MTTRIDRLAELGLVERIPDLVDRRLVRVRLTRHGRAVQDDALGSLVEYRSGLFADLSEGEIDGLSSLLRIVLLRLEQIPLD
jgi:DNA-binding MarR family transcriptional regulator